MTEEVKQEEKPEDKISEIERDNERMEKAIAKRKALAEELEKELARSRLGGQTEAGTLSKSKEDIQKEEDEKRVDEIYGSIYDLKKRRR